MTPKLSIIIPTLGRPTLAQTLKSLEGQIEEGDEVIIVCDGEEAHDKMLNVRWTFDFRVLDCIRHTREEYELCPGATQRNAVLDEGLASGDLLLFIGDDDIYREGALRSVREQASEHPDCPLMFRMITFWGDVIWRPSPNDAGNGRVGREGKFHEGGISDHIFVAPNVPELLGRYTNRYAGDYDYISSTNDKMGPAGRKLIWCPEIIVHSRPDTK